MRNGSWRQTTLGAFVADRGKSIEPSKQPREIFELYSVPSFPDRRPEILAGEKIGSNKQQVAPRSVLLCKINPRINRAWVVGDFSDHPKIASTEWIIFPEHEAIEPSFLCYFLQQNTVRDFLAANASGVGGSLMRVKASTFRDFPFSYPERDEQQRIVADIEKQFTRLDAGVASLKRVQTALKRYRASVLKAACEGRLVPSEAELARKENRSYETGEELLQRILKERCEKWNGKGKYKEAISPEATNFPALSEGWTLASLEELTSANRPICYGILMPKENVPDGVLYVKVKDMKGDRIDVASLYRTTREIASKYARASLRAGDLLLAIRGTYGRVAEIPPELNAGNITQDTARLDVTSLVDRRYVATCLRNPNCQNYFKRVARGVAVKGVNIADVKTTPIALPPLTEQQIIVMDVESQRFLPQRQ
jgi:type I restriction enzyme S subunit